VSHCGACNNACPSPANAIAGCTAGTCGIAACNGGFANCNNNPADGCEVNTSTSVNHCGACGNTCFTVNGTPACSNGQCFVAACNAGFANCNGNAADGCETNTNSDVNHCGACNNACGVGKACVNSTCVTL
jgi:hypothetical protein